jgi:hypothetical protein
MAEFPRKSFPELGRTGLVQFSGYIHEEILRELSGTRWARNVREMTSNDPVICALFFAIDKLTRQVTWEIQDNDKDPSGQEWGQFIRECLFDDMAQPWRETISEIHSYLPWGWSWHEIVLKRRDGKGSKFNDGRIGWDKWPIRAQESLDHWQIGDNGDIEGLWQRAAPKYDLVFIPRDKSLLFRTTAHKGNPEGHSLCRPLFRPWYFKKNIENIEAIGVERDLAGLPVIYVPQEIITAADGTDEAGILDYLKKVITGLKNNEQAGLLLPSDPWPQEQGGGKRFEFELASTAGNKQFDTRKIIQGKNVEICTSLLFDLILMGHERVGSFALADSKTEMVSYALGAFLDSDCEEINRRPIPQLLALNGAPQSTLENPPGLTHGDIESIDLETIGTFIEKMTGAGFSLTDQQLQYLLKQGGLPVPDDPNEMRPQQPEKTEGEEDSGNKKPET